ncbi:pentatricopeptide repeat-containing protein At5g15280, mitochondrial-like isoform X2 [Panicum virgatum]|uniref:pentatricopeptide repeat-containing protein At5g15280, mitochondrial-like isoform X2 n=1 Tax=Panicum virgatum TaxID=38727 RepID=UPI0019D65A45|nr:pentatricopeptide repeat-containing protein At5g15280, mitochondrial-like isoform X2 [Panicum virgatum]
MWKPWRLPGAIRIRHLRREAKFGGRGFANDAPKLNSDNGSLFRSGSSHVGENRNPVFAGAPEEAGSDFVQKTGGKSKPEAHSAVKSCSGIGSLIISKCAHIFESRRDTFDGKCSLQDVLKPGLWLSPETLRRFWRVSELKPEDYLDILIGFGSSSGQVRNARFLWNLYRWASQQSKEFQHLPRSNETMVAILVDAHMLSQAESLLLSLDDHMALAVSSELFSRIIQAYSEACNLEKSVALYDYARCKCLIPSVSCYQVLLHFLIRKRKDELILRVYLDMLQAGFGSCTKGDILDSVFIALIKKDNFLEALAILRQIKSLGLKLSKGSLSIIVEEFNKKKDIGDMMNFLEEWRCLPELRLCNRILASSCTNLGGVFREGLYRHAKYVFEDMVERKVTPNLSTYKIILAGYCWYRQFDDIEQVLRDMKTNGVNDLPSGNCALSKTLSFLGLDYLGVKIKRDNATGFPKAEFFDSVGNGLYLDTDSKKFEISLAQILDTALQPDVNSELVSASQQGNVANALLVKDEAFQWGYAISPASCSELFKALCVSPAFVIDAIDLMEEMPDIFDKFGAQSLNLFIQTLSRNGMPAHARLVFKKMVREGLSISQDTYTYLMIGFCKERNIAGFWECWNLATNYSWSPDSKDMMALTSCLCKWGVIEEALKLMNQLFDCYPDLFFSAYYALLEELCRTGLTSVGCAMLEALKEKGMVVDSSMLFCVMEGFLKEHKTAESIGMYDMWLYKCKELDTFTFRSILPSVPLLDMDRAKNLVESVLNMEFTEFSYCSCILKELVQTGNMKRVMQVLQESIPWKLSGTLLNSLIQAYGCLKNWRMLDAVLCMMLKMHANLSISSYRFLVCRMCEQSRFSSASSLRTLFQHSDKSRKLISCNILIFYLFQRRNTSQVHDLLKDMECNGISPDRMTYDFLVYGFHKSGDANSSVSMLDACIAQGIQPSNRSLRIVLSHHCKLGNLDKSQALFHLIESSGWKHGSIIRTILTSCLLSSGRHLEAKLCLNNLSKSEFIGSYTNFDDLVKKFCVLGDLKTALKLLDTMLKKGKLPSEVSYSSIIYRLFILKEFDQALDFLVEMQFASLTPSETSVDALVHGLCATGRTCDAMKILQMLITLGSVPSYGMYRVVLDSYCRSNNLQKATALLHDMQQAGQVPNFEMQWSIISNFSSTNEKAEGHGEPILPNLFLNPP